MLYDIVRKLPDGAQVQAELLTSEGGRLAVSAGSSRFELACLPKDDFPQMAAGALPHKFRLAADDLKRIIDKTRFAISTEETRYYLNGIYLHAAKDAKPPVMRAVATDGHRLARYELELPDGAADMPGVIVPRKTVGELSKLLEGADGAIDISLSDTKIQFGFNGVELTSKLIDGNFPPYERVIPAGNDKALGLDAKEFAQSVDRVSTISADKTRAVKLNLGKDKVTLWWSIPKAAPPPRMWARPTTPGRWKWVSMLAISWTSPARSKARKCASCCPTQARPPSSKTPRTGARSMSSCR
jgi:DNA polymerase-3 subunit beta